MSKKICNKHHHYNKICAECFESQLALKDERIRQLEIKVAGMKGALQRADKFMSVFWIVGLEGTTMADVQETAEMIQQALLTTPPTELEADLKAGVNVLRELVGTHGEPCPIDKGCHAKENGLNILSRLSRWLPKEG